MDFNKWSIYRSNQLKYSLFPVKHDSLFNKQILSKVLTYLTFSVCAQTGLIDGGQFGHLLAATIMNNVAKALDKNKNRHKLNSINF